MGNELVDTVNDVLKRRRLQSGAAFLWNADVELVFHFEQHFDEVERIESEAFKSCLGSDERRGDGEFLHQNSLNPLKSRSHDGLSCSASLSADQARDFRFDSITSMTQEKLRHLFGNIVPPLVECQNMIRVIDEK